MKLLLISPLPPPVGGIASWTVNMLKYFSANSTGWQVYHQNTAIKYREITNTGKWNRLIGGIRDTRRIIKEFKKNLDKIKPDVIHLTSSASIALFKDILLLILATKRSIPVTIHFRFGRIPALQERKNWEWYMLCKVIHKSHKVIVIDQKSYEALVRAGFKNIVNIPNPVSPDIEQKARIFLTNDNVRSNGRIIFVGHVIKNKGIFELVEACLNITSVKELIVIGPYEESIKKELLKLANSRDNGTWLKLIGPQNKDQVLEQMNKSSILALPSYTEGFPNVVIEAMAMGCAIIASEVGAIPEMIESKSETPCGLCVPIRNKELLIKAIEMLIEDPIKAKMMGRQGAVKILNNYALDKIIIQYQNIWEQALID
jgi:glycosyltransferase involved in cell wall biosynthesis